MRSKSNTLVYSIRKSASLKEAYTLVLLEDSYPNPNIVRVLSNSMIYKCKINQFSVERSYLAMPSRKLIKKTEDSI